MLRHMARKEKYTSRQLNATKKGMILPHHTSLRVDGILSPFAIVFRTKRDLFLSMASIVAD
jgi:hypothetical protein